MLSSEHEKKMTDDGYTKFIVIWLKTSGKNRISFIFSMPENMPDTKELSDSIINVLRRHIHRYSMIDNG